MTETTAILLAFVVGVGLILGGVLVLWGPKR